MSDEHDRLLRERARGGRQPTELWMLVFTILMMVLIGASVVVMVRG